MCLSHAQEADKEDPALSAVIAVSLQTEREDTARRVQKAEQIAALERQLRDLRGEEDAELPHGAFCKV